MSSGQLHRLLTVVISNQNRTNSHHAQLLRALGHTAKEQVTTKNELVNALLVMKTLPDLIITDISDPPALREVYRIVTDRNAQIPVLIIGTDIASMIRCDELDFVYGICTATVDQDSFQAILLLAIHRFEREQKLQEEARKAAEALEGTKAVARASAILFDRHGLKTMVAAHRKLQQIATSNQRTLPDQAERVIRADMEMHPKKTKSAAGSPKKRGS